MMFVIYDKDGSNDKKIMSTLKILIIKNWDIRTNFIIYFLLYGNDDTKSWNGENENENESGRNVKNLRQLQES